MVAPDVQLTVNHVRENFGEIPFIIFNYIREHGSPSLQEIINSTGLSISESRKAIFVLLKHFCISPVINKGVSKRSTIVYVPEFEKIYSRLCFPALVQNLTKKHKEEPLLIEVVKLLLKHGSTTANKMKNRFIKFDVPIETLCETLLQLKHFSYFKNFSEPLNVALNVMEHEGTGKEVYNVVKQSGIMTKIADSIYLQPLTVNFDVFNIRYLVRGRNNSIARYSNPHLSFSNERFCAKIIELVVKNRFGKSAHRIFRLLHLAHQLEQKQIS